MTWRMQWTILLGLLAMMMMGCSQLVESADTTVIEADVTVSDGHCEIHLGGYSTHDMIQIFETPHFDLHNPIGGLSFPTQCDDCPLTYVAVQGRMMTPQSTCDTDKQTCGTWYRVSWKKYADSTPILGWVSDRDEDIRWVGDCSNLPILEPDTTS